MADEPNNQIDRVLRSYAEERRKAPPAPLHPANRALLHQERRRVYGEVERNSISTKASWLARFWPQFTFATVACAALAMGLFVFERSKAPVQLVSQLTPSPPVPTPAQRSNPRQLAENSALPAEPGSRAGSLKKSVELTGAKLAKSDGKRAELQPAKSEETVLAIKPPSAPADQQAKQLAANAPDPIAANESESISRDASKVQPETAVKLPALQLADAEPRSAREAFKSKAIPALVPTDNEGLRSQNRVLRDTREPQVALQLATQAPGGQASSSFGFAVAKDSSEVEAAPRTYLVATTNRPPASGSGSLAFRSVLASFQLEERGDQVRFIDFDGSTYEGSLARVARRAAAQTAHQDSSQRGAIERPAVKLKEPSQPPSPLWSFRVTGQNLTLGRDVVFTGYLLRSQQTPPTSNTASGAVGIAATSKPSVSMVAGMIDAPKTNPGPTLVTGTAVIGATNWVQIRAIPRR